jgi:AFG3 family protein
MSAILSRIIGRQSTLRSFFVFSKPPKGFEKFFRVKESPKDPSGNPSGPTGSTPPPGSWQQGAALGILAYTLFQLTSSSNPQRDVSFQEFLGEYLYKGRVSKIDVINRQFARVHLNDASEPPLKINLSSPEQFESKLDVIQSQLGLDPVQFVPVEHKEEIVLSDELFKYLPSLLLLIPIILSMRMLSTGLKDLGSGGSGGKGGVFSFRKANPITPKDMKQKVKFSDVAGLTQVKQEIQEFVEFLKNPGNFTSLGAKIPRGALLSGPPGCGKTLLAKAVAGEAGVPFYSMSGSDFIEMFVGVGPSRVRDLFAQARKTAPSIIFIDEIDAVGRKRGKGGFGGGGNDERENTLNQLLVEMDGMNTSTGVIVLAGTNRADILDPALVRAGRFDRNIVVDKPDLEERRDIFLVHLKIVKVEKDIAKDEVARRLAALTPGLVGADIANICNESAIFAARRKAENVGMDDFERATERILGGLTKSKNLMGEEERKTVALHESGHAVAGWFLKHADPLLKVSIIPRSNGALGFAQYLPEELALYSKDALLDKICTILSGRAAEELFTGRITTGAADDFEKVTNIAYGMVQMYGMAGNIGPLAFNLERNRETFVRQFSEATAEKIDIEVRKLVEEQYSRSKALLTEYEHKVKALSELLFLKETVVYADLKAVLGERPWPIKKEYARFVEAGFKASEPPVNSQTVSAGDAVPA